MTKDSQLHRSTQLTHSPSQSPSHPEALLGIVSQRKKSVVADCSTVAGCGPCLSLVLSALCGVMVWCAVAVAVAGWWRWGVVCRLD